MNSEMTMLVVMMPAIIPSKTLNYRETTDKYASTNHSKCTGNPKTRAIAAASRK